MNDSFWNEVLNLSESNKLFFPRQEPPVSFTEEELSKLREYSLAEWEPFFDFSAQHKFQKPKAKTNWSIEGF